MSWLWSCAEVPICVSLDVAYIAGVCDSSEFACGCCCICACWVDGGSGDGIAFKCDDCCICTCWGSEVVGGGNVGGSNDDCDDTFVYTGFAVTSFFDDLWKEQNFRWVNE